MINETKCHHFLATMYLSAQAIQYYCCIAAAAATVTMTTKHWKAQSQ